LFSKKPMPNGQLDGFIEEKAEIKWSRSQDDYGRRSFLSAIYS